MMTVLTTMESVNSLDADNPIENDLRLINGHLNFFDGTDAIKQKVKERLLFFQGDWYLDQKLGVPYWTEVFVSNPDISRLRSLFRQVVVTTPGIGSLDALEVSFDKANRSISIEFNATTDDGQQFSSAPFVVVL
jgi:hypothetical protein